MDSETTWGFTLGVCLIITWFITQVGLIIYVAYTMKKIKKELVDKGRLIPLMSNFIPTPVLPGMIGVAAQSQTLPPACK